MAISVSSSTFIDDLLIARILPSLVVVFLEEGYFDHPIQTPRVWRNGMRSQEVSLVGNSNSSDGNTSLFFSQPTFR